MGTAAVDPASTSISLDDIEVQGDVCVHLFEVTKSTFSAQQAVSEVTNVKDTKGVLLSFFFHTGFLPLEVMTTEEFRISQGTEGQCIDKKPLTGTLRLHITELDNAKTGVKKGLHAEGSGIALRYTALEAGDEGMGADALEPAHVQVELTNGMASAVPSSPSRRFRV